MLSARRAERRAALSFVDTDNLMRRLSALREECEDRRTGALERASLKARVEDYEAVLNERGEREDPRVAFARSAS